MNRFRFTIKLVVIATFLLAFASIAQAQATRTWVSGVGDDVNPCSRTAPCKTFAGAISKTAAGGEIDALDPGGFGTVTITKSITIDGTHGAGFGSILAAGTNGVNVNDSATASPNTIIVALRNLSINGAGTGFDGIRFISGKELYVEDCIIANFRGNSTNSDGIEAALNNAPASTARLVVKDTIIRNNSGTAIRVANTFAGGAIAVTLENVELNSNNAGFAGNTSSRSHIINSTMSFNTGAGIAAGTGNLGVDVDGAQLFSNGTGLQLSASTTRISNMRIVNNSTGVNFGGGTLVTYGDNRINGNGTDVVGGVIPGPISKQ